MNIKKHMKRNLVIILTVLGLIGLTLSLTAGCSEQDGALVQESQTVTVQRGNLSLEITAAGNLALSQTEDLAFEIGGTSQDPLTVEEILVEEGDSVKKGQVIARLDTTTLEDAIETQEEAVKKAEDAVYTAELSVRTAKINLETAADEYREIIYPLDYYTFNLRVPEAISFITDAEQQLKEGMKLLESYPSQEQYLEIKEKVVQAREDLKDAGENLDTGAWKEFIEVKTRVISGVEVETEYLPSSFWGQITTAQTKIDTAQISLDKATKDVDQANSDLEKAKDAVNEAKEELDKAVIVAPFDGFITTVNVAGGDEVARGTVAVQLADPNKFEAGVLVSEMDIYQVEVGGEATVQVDALQNLSFPAEVTHIAPTATIQSGVVNYQVTVELDPLQAEVSEDIELKEGLSVTVSIVTEQRTDVLLVPYTAITSEGGQSYVQVVSPTGTIEKRAIKTGISDYQYTEVTEGLNEGEQVLVSKVTTASESSKSTTTQQQSEGGMMIPGMGGQGGPPSGG